jgi:hypothetical protein
MSETIADIGPQRSRRGIPLMAIAGIASLAEKIYSAYTNYKFRKKVSSALKYLKNHQDSMTARLTTLQKSHVLLANFTTGALMNMKLDALVRATIQNREIKQIRTSIQSLHELQNAERVVDQDTQMLHSHLILAFMRNSENLDVLSSKMLEIARSYQDALFTLQREYIPRELISPSQLSEILLNTREKLAEKGDYSLLFGQQLHPYYHMKMTNGFFLDNILYITLSLPLKHTNFEVFDFYKVSTFYVPSNLTRRQKLINSTYTRLDTSTSYLAINEGLYAEFEMDFLEQCEVYGGIYISKTALLHTNNKYPSCVSAIFLDEHHTKIFELCKFQLFPHIHLPATVIETEEYYLLINVENKFSVTCKSNMKSSFQKGHTYSVVMKKGMCQCYLQTDVHILLTPNTDCELGTGDFTVKYVHNFAVASIIHRDDDDVSPSSLLMLSDTPTPYALPLLDVIEGEEDNVLNLISEADGIDLDRYYDMLEQQKDGLDIYKTGSAINQDEDDIVAWFDEDEPHYTNIFIFLASVVSLLTFVAMVALCYKYGNVAHAMAYMTTALHGTEAVKFVPTIENHLQSITSIAYIGCIVSILYLLRALYKNCVKYREWRINNVSYPWQKTVDIEIQILSTQGTVNVYLASLKAEILDLYLKEETVVYSAALTGDIWRNTLKLAKGIDLYAHGSDKPIHLPLVTNVPMLNFYTVRRILSGDYIIRIVATASGRLYCVSNRGGRKIKKRHSAIQNPTRPDASAPIEPISTRHETNLDID